MTEEAMTPESEQAVERLRLDAEVLSDELNDLVIRVIEDPDGDCARYTGDIGRDLRLILTALAHSEARERGLRDDAERWRTFCEHGLTQRGREVITIFADEQRAAPMSPAAHECLQNAIIASAESGNKTEE